MDQVTTQRCQVTIDGRIRTFDKGVVLDYDGEHPYLRPLAGQVEEAQDVDFLTASEEELLKAAWKFSDAATAIKEAYNVELKKTEKPDVVAQILDARFRAVNPSDTDHTR